MVDQVGLVLGDFPFALSNDSFELLFGLFVIRDEFVALFGNIEFLEHDQGVAGHHERVLVVHNREPVDVHPLLGFVAFESEIGRPGEILPVDGQLG